ncbi:RNA 2',3'-cyclic phosphodiesterase [Desulforhabdus amnigena]|jgi:2'-5' RNA ligase|uniref:RNA 2',3'-cyclic phosphodiesterase n=1 Tax=Desulforhabdus amnigena TaxID=40218 RepID=A0A9W6L9M3_9BACT|nr:RNA 2',3'-cyclic phosphodiesterase [Desulforhabdus amnigena]NLJ28904.1 RNA 2',3'-cyclic phosphodiesterase [Deltaproteobacteria bacterium]GLI35639.1 RNA 2',3'-cyclic phosphodiesterase [Desulforhabdus amnigena]
MIRTFIAFDLPVNVQESLQRLQSELKKTEAHVSWVKPERIHLTLKFLGDVSPEQIPAIQSALEVIAASTRSFRLKVAGCGAFPTIKQMRVVWVGIRGDEAPLKELQGQVEQAMVPLGFKAEDRPFKAHLTLGRVKGRQRLRSLQDALMTYHAFEAEDFDVTELVLYKSELRPEGARYTPLFRSSFKQ